MKNKCGAFTLIELVIVLAITGILLMLSIPSFKSLTQKNSALSKTYEIFHTLQYARTEAIKRNQHIKVCGTTDSKHCGPDWSLGYMVFIDKNQDNILNNEDLLLRANNQPAKNMNISSKNVKSIRYASNGRCLTRCTIGLESPNQFLNAIVIYDSGRARILF